MVREGKTRKKALVEAGKFLQEVGYNSFSFQQLADVLSIKKPSLYTHFKSKEDLGTCLIEEAKVRFMTWTKAIEALPPDQQIIELFEIFCQFSYDAKKICLLSALGADCNSLPQTMHTALAELYASREAWLKEVIERGQEQGLFRTDCTSTGLANLVLATGLGAQLCARVLDDPEQIRNVKQQILVLLASEQMK